MLLKDLRFFGVARTLLMGGKCVYCRGRIGEVGGFLVMASWRVWASLVLHPASLARGTLRNEAEQCWLDPSSVVTPMTPPPA